MDLIRDMVSLDGRSSRKAMVMVTAAFLLIGLVRGQLASGGAMTAAAVLLALQLILIWPAHIAIPVKRLHDMGRRGFWVAVFWGGAIFGAAFILFDLATRAPLVGMTLTEAVTNTGAYVEAINTIAASAPAEEAKRYLPLSATGWGGFSLAMIFLAIQFGWLHFIPGQTSANRFGAPRASDTTR